MGIFLDPDFKISLLRALLLPAVACPVSASPEVYKNNGLQMERTSFFAYSALLHSGYMLTRQSTWRHVECHCGGQCRQGSAPVGGAVETAYSAFGHAANAGAGKAPGASVPRFHGLE